MRDHKTLEFIRQCDSDLAERVSLVPDPTWLFWPEILTGSPLKYKPLDGRVRSYHHLIAHLMAGRKVTSVIDLRPKTQELARDFQVQDWNCEFVRQRCRQLREAGWEHLRCLGFATPHHSNPPDFATPFTAEKSYLRA